MEKLLLAIISRGKFGLISTLGKVAIAGMVCCHPELSNEKVESMTSMMK